MPLPKSLRPPQSHPKSKVPKRSGSCPLCNSLSPLNHSQTSYATESKKHVQKSLTLALDGLLLQKKSDCNHCKLLCDALDAFFKDWRRNRGRLVVELGERRPVIVKLEGEECYLEIFGAAGECNPFKS